MDQLNNYEDFIALAKKNSYASRKPGLLLPDKSKTFVFENNNFRYVDTYYGYNPFGGQEIVYRKEEGGLNPIWYMNYGGSCLEIENRYTVEGIFQILKTALSLVNKYHPFRGPKQFDSGDFVYKVEFSGGLDFFSGSERIYLDNSMLYIGHFFGGILRPKEALDIGI